MKEKISPSGPDQYLARSEKKNLPNRSGYKNTQLENKKSTNHQKSTLASFKNTSQVLAIWLDVLMCIQHVYFLVYYYHHFKTKIIVD